MTDDNSGRKADIARAIELARRVDAGQEPLTPFDPAAALVDDEEIAAFMADAFETGDAAYIAHAREVAARAKAMHGLADLIAGTGNVYADLGYPDAAAMFDKARRVARIAVAIEARQWSPEQAAAALDMTPAELRELLAGRFRGHSLDDLERLASRIEK